MVMGYCRKAILELMQAIDDYIPDPTRALDKPFSLPVEDVFSIQGRGTVVTGCVEQGVVKVGEEIEIIGIQPATKTTVTGERPNRSWLPPNISMCRLYIAPTASVMCRVTA